jgi:hypothetical protein
VKLVISPNSNVGQICDTCYVSVVLKVDSEPVISFFNEGKSISPGLPFLHFCKKYDICNERDSVSGCAYGKISVITPIPYFNQFIQPTNATM